MPTVEATSRPESPSLLQTELEHLSDVAKAHRLFRDVQETAKAFPDYKEELIEQMADALADEESLPAAIHFLESQPDKSKWLNKIMVYRYRLGQKDEVLKLMKEAKKRRDDGALKDQVPRVYEKISNLETDAGNFELARELANESEGLARSLALLHLMDQQLAKKMFADAQETQSDITRPREKLSSLVKIVVALAEAGQFEQAKILIKTIENDNSDHSEYYANEAWANIGIRYAKAGRFQEAQDAASQILSDSHAKNVIYYTIAMQQLQSGDLQLEKAAHEVMLNSFSATDNDLGLLTEYQQKLWELGEFEELLKSLAEGTSESFAVKLAKEALKSGNMQFYERLAAVFKGGRSAEAEFAKIKFVFNFASQVSKDTNGEEISQWLKRIPEEADHYDVIYLMAVELAEKELFSQVNSLTFEVDDSQFKDSLTALVAEKQARLGRFEEALKSLQYPYLEFEVRAYSILAKIAFDQGNSAAVHQILSRALDNIKSTNQPINPLELKQLLKLARDFEDQPMVETIVTFWRTPNAMEETDMIASWTHDTPDEDEESEQEKKLDRQHFEQEMVLLTELAKVGKDYLHKHQHQPIQFGLIARSLDKLPREQVIEIAQMVGSVADKAQAGEFLVGLPFSDPEIIRSIKLIVDKNAIDANTRYLATGSVEIATHLSEQLDLILAGKIDDAKLLKELTECLYLLNTKEAKDVILQAARKAANATESAVMKNPDRVLLRLLKVLSEVNTWKGNDLVLTIAATEETGIKASIYLIRKLIENQYFDQKFGEWFEEFFAEAVGNSARQETIACNAIKKIIRGGITPSKSVMVYLLGSDGSSPLLAQNLEAKLQMLAKYEAEFSKQEASSDLVRLLANNRDKALAYYILHSGEARFSLVNNYNFEKFEEILEIANKLHFHPGPFSEFEESLSAAGHSEEKIRRILENLKKGHHPFHAEESKTLERSIRLDVSDNTKLQNANTEIGNVFGSYQLGAILRRVMYRKYLTELQATELIGPQATALLDELQQSTTFVGVTLHKIEQIFPDVVKRLQADLAVPWQELGSKTLLNVSLENVLTVEQNPINTSQIIGQVEEKRISLRNAKKELLAALRMDNPRWKVLRSELDRKNKALANLHEGLTRKPDDAILQTKVRDLENDIADLKRQFDEIQSTPLSERYAHLSDEQRALIQQTTESIRALADKDVTSIFTYLIAEVIGEENLLESDVELLKEMASHLEGPFQMVSDLERLDDSGRSTRQQETVRVRMLDKTADLLTMARFADSKICCFTSSNYEVRVAHGIPNKYWVASILADPLSFVFTIESEQNSPSDDDTAQKKEAQNMGFVFGMYGKAAESGKPAVFLNGVYLSTGNDKVSAESILSAIEEMLSRPVAAEYQLVAQQYGGGIAGKLAEYQDTDLQAKRLRALVDMNVQVETVDEQYNEEGYPISPQALSIQSATFAPQTQVYDDLGHQLNTEQPYGKYVWHKKL